jgi:putative zinc finger protein
MNCDRAQAAVSERMDGERLPTRVAAAVDEHLEGCAGCRTFVDRASRVRTAVRIRPAERIPDLVGPIMAEVARTSRPRVRRLRRRHDVGRPRTLAPVAAALAVGVVAGSLVVGGPWQDHAGDTSASAADVIRHVGVAARHVEAYHATFTIEERGYSTAVPLRSFESELWFAAPGRYRLDVDDLTDYPSDAWTPMDLRYVEAGTAVVIKGPTGCSRVLPPSECPPTQSVNSDRSPYSTEAPIATDLVVPLDVLANPRGLTVERTGTVLGRDAVLIRTTFARAAPLFPFVDLGGTWRPFFSGDRVDLWVDANEWSPLRWTVYPADDPARADWELIFGLLPEPVDTPILDVAVTASDHDPPGPGRFAAAHAAPSVPVNKLSEQVGFHPVTPTATEDLALTETAVPRGGEDAPESLLTFSSGLAYLQVAERHHWNGSGLFGPVDPSAERVQVGNGVAYYEPADARHGRRLAIHTDDRNLYLETNLPREDLLAVAASLPLEGQALPDSWNLRHASDVRTQRLTLAQAKARTSFAFDVPDEVPGGYVLASVERTVVRGAESVTIGLRQRDSDLGAGPIRIYLEAADALPPAAAVEQETVPLGELDARWIPSQGRLEWIDHGVYRSIDGPGVDRRILAAIAASVEAAA